MSGPPRDSDAPIPDALRGRLTALAAPTRLYPRVGLHVARWALQLVEGWPYREDEVLEEDVLKACIHHIQLSGEVDRVDSYLTVARLAGTEAVKAMLAEDRQRYYAAKVKR